MEQAPWGKIDVDQEIQRQVDLITRDNPRLPKIHLGRRGASQTKWGSIAEGWMDYNAIVDGNNSRVRITWREIKWVNQVTQIEQFSDDDLRHSLWSIGKGATPSVVRVGSTPPTP